MNGYGSFFAPQYNPDFDFFQALRGYFKFAVAVLFFFTLLAILLWNMQPWFELEIKPKNATTENMLNKNSEMALQSDMEIFNHVVLSGETLSEIAEHYGVPFSNLSKQNNLDNPNVLRAGQRLQILRPRQR